jgi:hypothetical protein
MARWKRKLRKSNALPCRRSNLTQGRPKEPSVGHQIIPRKEKLVRVDKLDFSLIKMNPTLTKGERAFINGQQLLKGETRMMTTPRQKTRL